MMEWTQYHERFGGAARTGFAEKRGVPISKVDGLPGGFVRMDPWEIEYLYGIAHRCRVGVLEIGRLLGGSTFALACAANVPIWSIDNAPHDDEQLRRYLKKHNVPSQVTLIVGESQKVSTRQVGDIDLLFVDGDHHYEGVRDDLDHWYRNVVAGGSIVLHDCCERDVRRAALEFIEQHQEFGVVLSPSNVPDDLWWELPTGSLGHLVRR